jgi:glycosyltransferase involved in cell wall biosynthesis
MMTLLPEPHSYSLGSQRTDSASLPEAIGWSKPAAIKRIAIFEPYIFDQPYGNLRYVCALFKYFDRERFKPLLIAPRRTEFFMTIESLGGRCICVPAPARLLTFGGTLLKARAVAKLRAIVSLALYNLAISRKLKRQRVDILHCNNIRSVMMAGWGAWLSRCPLVWYVKGELANPMLDRLGFFLAKRVVFQSTANMRRSYPRLLQRYRDKVAILENGVDFEELAEAQRKVRPQLREELGLRSSWVNFACLGQISPLKGLNYLLEAMAIVQREALIALYLLGNHGAEEYRSYIDELKSFVTKHHLREIHFLGWREDRLEILSLMDGYVLPSLSEGARGEDPQTGARPAAPYPDGSTRV